MSNWWTDTTDTVKSGASVATMGLYDPNGGTDYTYTPALISDQDLIAQIQANAALDYSNTAAAYYSSMQSSPNNAALTQYNMSQGLATSAQGINANTANQVAQTSYQTAAFNAGQKNAASQYNNTMNYTQDNAEMNRIAGMIGGGAQALGAMAGMGALGAGASALAGGSTGMGGEYVASEMSPSYGLWGSGGGMSRFTLGS